MNDQQRLLTWLQVNKYTYRRAARLIGIDHVSLFLQATGKRPLSDGIRWKIRQRFGNDVADELFRDGRVAQETNDAAYATL